jgi:hypothetical protein
MAALPFAEDVNYWKTGRSAPDAWMDRAKGEIEKAGGEIFGSAIVTEDATGRAGFMLVFRLDGERFKIAWPVLPSKSGDEKAARIQAATMLYHDVKARCVSARVLGARAAFFNYLLLPDGRAAAEASTPELMDDVPLMLAEARPLELPPPGSA